SVVSHARRYGCGRVRSAGPPSARQTPTTGTTALIVVGSSLGAATLRFPASHATETTPHDCDGGIENPKWTSGSSRAPTVATRLFPLAVASVMWICPFSSSCCSAQTRLVLKNAVAATRGGTSVTPLLNGIAVRMLP